MGTQGPGHARTGGRAFLFPVEPVLSFADLLGTATLYRTPTSVQRINGLIAAAHTPFSRGQLNPEMVREQYHLLRSMGLAGVFVCGTTGEFASLTVQERRRLAEAWVQESGPSWPVIIHVGHNCQTDAVDLAAHAREIGASAIAAMAPSYFRPADLDDLLAFLTPIAAAAPELPFYYYDIPSMTQVGLPADQILDGGRHRIPNLAGLKFSHSDLAVLQACVEQPGYEVFFGMDEILLSALVLGVRGAVGSTYNFAAPLFFRIINALASGNLEEARASQRTATALFRATVPFGPLQASKAAMAFLGVDCGPVRPPLRRLDPHALWRLYETLTAFDAFPHPLRPPPRP